MIYEGLKDQLEVRIGVFIRAGLQAFGPGGRNPTVPSISQTSQQAIKKAEEIFPIGFFSFLCN
jgi:hypothetical protein